VYFDDRVRHFAMDSIAKCVFGMDVDSAAEPDNEFTKNGADFIQPWRFFLSTLFPTLCRWLNLGVFNPYAADYFTRVTRKIIKQRDNDGGNYDDILGLMMRARNGELERSEEDFGGGKGVSPLMTNK